MILSGKKEYFRRALEFGQSFLEDMVMNREFWKGRKVFITGHTGFKGSWLSLWLQSLGAQVTGYALDPPTQPSLFDLADIGDHMTSVKGDIRDSAHLKETISHNQPEIIIHMAAQSLVRQSYINPVETYETNIMGTVNILEAVRFEKSVRVVVIVTSDKCYENREWSWGYRENEPMGGYDPYASSKGCAELITSAYRSSFFPTKQCGQHSVAIASVRAGNVIGGGDWADDRLIPDIMKSFLNNSSVLIRNPHAIRPWQHVLDPLCGYLCLIERLWKDGVTFGEAWNFGPNIDEARTVSWIVDSMARLWGDGARWDIDAGTHPHEAHYLKLDSSKARNQLQWTPKIVLSDALNRIITWYKCFQQGDDMRRITQTEIERFENISDVRIEHEYHTL
jgi:CDP-glucose 4,6-dehydratase